MDSASTTLPEIVQPATNTGSRKQSVWQMIRWLFGLLLLQSPFWTLSLNHRLLKVVVLDKELSWRKELDG